MTRRRPATLAAAGLLFVAVAGSSGQAPEAPRMLAVGDNIGTLFLLAGGGPHTLAFGAEDETITIIDPKGVGSGRMVAEKVRNGADGTVTRLINTNARRADSNAEFPTAVEIVAHENTRAALAKMSGFKGANAKFLPNRTFTDTLSLTVKTVGEDKGTNRIDLYYFGAGSTNGDAVVVFPSLDTVYMGDLFPAKALPAIDLANGGSAVAFPDTLDKALTALRAVPGLKIVMPGRMMPPPGPYVPRWLSLRDLQEYAEFTRDFLSAVKTAMQAGRTAEQAVAELRMPEKYKTYGLENAAANVQAIYAELRK